MKKVLVSLILIFSISNVMAKNRGGEGGEGGKII
jgi:hypothetical protein